MSVKEFEKKKCENMASILRCVCGYIYFTFKSKILPCCCCCWIEAANLLIDDGKRISVLISLSVTHLLLVVAFGI
jgi:hypothetical protein